MSKPDSLTDIYLTKLVKIHLSLITARHRLMLENIVKAFVMLMKVYRQELSYRKQIARKLRTLHVEGI